MRRALVTTLLCWVLASHARADSGAADGESARAAALGDAVVGRAGDTSAIWLNPAGIADLSHTTLTVLGHAAYLRVDQARTGDASTSSERAIGGYGLSLVVPLPGPDWLRRVHLGASVHVPTSGIITVAAGTRDDVPDAPMYGTRLERTAASFALGIALPGNIDIGIGATVAPTLIAPTYVSYDARRGTSVDDGVIVRLDRDVQFGGSFSLGLRWQPVPAFGVGLVYRGAVGLRAQGPINLRAGSVLADDPLDFVDFFSPEQAATGLSFQLSPELSLSTDLTWLRWSSYLTVHDHAPSPVWHDTVNLSAGAEYVVDRWAALRLGYAWVPSPVPAQIGVSSYLDADRHVLSGGFGADLEAALGVPLHLDLYVRAHVVGDIAFTKERDALGDADPNTPGQQIAALGFPGMHADILYFQAGLSATLTLGRAPARHAEVGATGAEHVIDEAIEEQLERDVDDEVEREVIESEREAETEREVEADLERQLELREEAAEDAQVEHDLDAESATESEATP